MTRIVWHRVRWKGAARDLAKGLKRCRYEESTGNGFVVDRVRDDRLDARFVERIDMRRMFIDPFGNETQETRIDYRVAQFSYRGSAPELEIIDPTRHSSLFVQRLADAMEFSASFSRVEVDPLEWCSELQARMSIDIRVRSLSISDLSVGKGVTATATLGGDVDVREALSRFAGKKSFSLDKVEFESMPDAKSTVRLGRAGSANISGGRVNEFIDALRKSLAQTLKG